MTTLGQARAKHTLQQLLEGGRMPHALLLSGRTGWGSLALALELAQRLQCTAYPLPDPNQQSLFGETDVLSSLPSFEAAAACTCNACQKSQKFVHPDIHFSYPTVGAQAVSTDFIKEWRTALSEQPYFNAYQWLQRLGADNKQGNINTAECNALLKKISFKAFEGRCKVVVLWLPEYLGKEGNRLLKIMEEPPEQTHFILVSEQTEQVLPTILSRCQLVKIDPLTDEAVVEGLKHYRQMDTDRAVQLALLAEGDFNLALQLADQPDSDEHGLFIDWLRKCWRGYGPDLVQWTDAFAKLGRENQKQLLLYGLHFLRETLRLVVLGDYPLRLRPAESTVAHNMAKILTVEKIEILTEMLNENIQYLERNANAKVLFLDTSIRMHGILKGDIKQPSTISQ